MFTETEPYKRIGIRDQNGGVNSFYSSDMTKAEVDMIDRWCDELKIPV